MAQEAARDDGIEKVLKHMGFWDPPWKRQRPARGPPSASPAPCAGFRPTIEPDQKRCEPWLEGIDPPHAEDSVDPPYNDE